MTAQVRILYIEDDRGGAELLRSYLTQFNWLVTLAVDGHSALAQYHASKFDIVLIDQTLPDITGLEVLRELNRLDEFPPATIMVTGTGDEQTAVTAMKYGADDYIVKDVDGIYFELLPTVINRALERRELRRNQQRLMLEQSRLIEELRAFNYAVAHDLKQPLSVLQTSTHLLERFLEDPTSERAKHKLTQMSETIDKMNDTLEALILFARIRETTLVEFQAVDMLELVKKVCQHLDDMIEETQAVILIPDSLPSALGYEPWIERIWVNYLSNALKYGGNPPRIEVGASVQPNGSVHYWVKDNGDGLTREEQTQLFIPFSRLRERQEEGHGLGLAIVNLITRRLGGEVTASSTPGEGSTFGFILTEAALL